MRKTRALLLGCFVCLPLTLPGAETAAARLDCLSLRFQSVEDMTGEYLLTLSDGELWPYNSNSHAANLTLNDLYLDETYTGYIVLAVPDSTDANGDGYADFYESSQEVNASTTGSYNIANWGSGGLTANWTRSAGSSYGTCILNFNPIPGYTQNTFVIPFQLLEFSGPLTYTPGQTNVLGSLNLAQTDAPGSTLAGNFAFTKIATNRFNSLVLQPGMWSNSVPQALGFTNSVFRRAAAWPTNYYGYVVFDTFDPNSSQPVYQVWTLSIDDTSDANHNGIPDFSDDPPTALPRQPVLSLVETATNLLLSINGDTNHLHEVQQNGLLGTNGWTTVATLTLTNSPAVVPLALPSGPASFWRVVAQ